mgnify:FL=1|tara:strand:- start:143 stop:490 length:348 start_codon:yes stop_codon:yes gene_type:complete
MTIQYKNSKFSLSGTGQTTILSISVTAVAIVKSVSIANTSSGTVTVKARMKDYSASNANARFYVKAMATNTQDNATSEPLNLESGDAIELQSSEGGGVIEGVVSYALIDRSQENG